MKQGGIHEKSKFCLLYWPRASVRDVDVILHRKTDEATTAPSSRDGVVTPTAEPVTPEPPAKITLFMSNSGIAIPETVDPASNMYIDRICELANVEITEIVIPPYADFATRLTLMLSSNDIKDLVHNYQTADINTAGAAGAFVECSDIIKNSPVISAIYTDQMLDSIRYSDGKIYHIRAVAPPDPNCLTVRYDLIKELNNGVIPTTLNDWYNVWVAEKTKFPTAFRSPIYGITIYTGFIFNAYGVDWPGTGWQYTFGKFIHSFEATHMGKPSSSTRSCTTKGCSAPHLRPTCRPMRPMSGSRRRPSSGATTWPRVPASSSSLEI